MCRGHVSAKGLFIYHPPTNNIAATSAGPCKTLTLFIFCQFVVALWEYLNANSHLHANETRAKSAFKWATPAVISSVDVAVTGYIAAWPLKLHLLCLLSF